MSRENAAWERRRAQAEKDAREIASPVSGPSAGGFYALRPLHKRVEARRLEDHEHLLRGDGLCRCGRKLGEIIRRRNAKRQNRATARHRRFHRPVSAKNAARAAA